MDQTPPRRQDPLALAVLGGAVALIVVLGLALLYSIRSQPAPQAGEPAAESFPQQVRNAVRRMIGEAQKAAQSPAPVAKPQPPQPQAQAPKPQARASSAPPSPESAPARGRVVLEAGRSWRYIVKVEPEVWKDVTLTYRTAQESGAIGVRTEFNYAGGKSAFALGTFAANHPTHANTRFPGFFMYAAYLEQPLEPGQRIVFGWPWQGGTKPGRVKRFEGKVAGWEEVQLPGGKLQAARIDGMLLYAEEGKVQAQVRETLWYAPKVAQVVKIVREGRSPDESATRIVAELAEYR